ncbi:hypothetical protein ACFFHM_03175 [Halalkalibacter kiskunsagensis]|uniref:Transposase n=1 Tax=Halalkalibacter kiskunsagensis TaxID=1548599 RepID=A0ABV6K8C3_9BACI
MSQTQALELLVTRFEKKLKRVLRQEEINLLKETVDKSFKKFKVTKT